MDKLQETAFTDYNAPSSEPFRLNLNNNAHNWRVKANGKKQIHAV
jgi:hypothetical protein